MEKQTKIGLIAFVAILAATIAVVGNYSGFFALVVLGGGIWLAFRVLRWSEQ
jgi:hypothetical protein